MKRKECSICGRSSTMVSGSIRGLQCCNRHTLEERNEFLKDKWNSYWKEVTVKKKGSK